MMFAPTTQWISLVFILLAFADWGIAGSATHIRVLYPSFAGSWAPAWITEEAGFFANEGLDVELIRVGEIKSEA